MEQYLIEHLSSLPEPIRDFVTSKDFIAKLTRVFSDYNIAQEERSEILQEIVMFVCGYTHPEDFGEYISSWLILDDSDQVDFVEKIEGLLDPISADLTKLWFEEYKNINLPEKVDLEEKENTSPARHSTNLPPQEAQITQVAQTTRDIASQALRGSFKAPAQRKKMSDDDFKKMSAGNSYREPL